MNIVPTAITPGQARAADAPAPKAQAPAPSDPLDAVYGTKLDELQRKEEENIKKAEELRRASETSQHKSHTARNLSLFLCGAGALACFAAAAAGGVSGLLGPIVLFGGPIAFFTFDMISKSRADRAYTEAREAQATQAQNTGIAKERESTLEQKKSAESLIRRDTVKTGEEALIREEEQAVRIDGVRLKKAAPAKREAE